MERGRGEEGGEGELRGVSSLMLFGMREDERGDGTRVAPLCPF
jgi:hypothetical protein